jgi:hypothetical protein
MKNILKTFHITSTIDYDSLNFSKRYTKYIGREDQK